jgi:hypothetical protein
LRRKCNAWKEDFEGIESDYREDCCEVDEKRAKEGRLNWQSLADARRIGLGFESFFRLVRRPLSL